MGDQSFPLTRDEVTEAMKAFVRSAGDRHLGPNVLFMPHEMELAVRRWGVDQLGGGPSGFFDEGPRHWMFFGMMVVPGAPRFVLAHVPRGEPDPCRRAVLAYALREHYGADDPGVVFWPE